MKLFNFYKGHKITISGVEYTLKGAPPGGRGFQFRAHFVEDKRSRKYVAKMTNDSKKFMREFSTYNYLRNYNYPERYFPKIKNSGQVLYQEDSIGYVETSFVGFVMKYYK